MNYTFREIIVQKASRENDLQILIFNPRLMHTSNGRLVKFTMNDVVHILRILEEHGIDATVTIPTNFTDPINMFLNGWVLQQQMSGQYEPSMGNHFGALLALCAEYAVQACFMNEDNMYILGENTTIIDEYDPSIECEDV